MQNSFSYLPLVFLVNLYFEHREIARILCLDEQEVVERLLHYEYTILVYH
jgi:hypothetical protein